ncbi:bifunctional 4-hydroxy-2-oxoglutarate aldolase/2-dehydro-3-deoxy-phosphogluconate aldolase [Akkermansia muciniphila]|uniref:bifunctional 4-hydroxy-2-oxoglutarate aldolase/2-dehydro-3-deoxy-phosphogluconate aldolase n=1 Tax=Akkermansia muciniphila TaxID=239935 RepID=UPI00138E912B|nr:bifunctional 4-hydroxy-2-oxoglutarate aldolase/2-dehydro-3-deoxy-phosphogluconate aldolase [Akkermansia muciniphila]QHV14947.1 2-dehydro-3-deoxyphosphogluconate aldolase [Akkermansia muciniphila]QHV17418.1 2-dehydro-3-deoxyphosphogluconate aldolase [Akkermansia muciniphila]
MKTLLEKLIAVKLVPVVVIHDADKALPLAKALLDNGCGCMEITFRTPSAAEAITRISRELPGMLVGAGTLLTPEQAQAARRAGASFGVAPGFDPQVVKAAAALDFPFVPGVSTASEISQALSLGCLFQKFFPAEAAGGVKMLKSLLAAFRHTGVRIMPTGGINAGNIGSWLEIPEVAACGGSWICEAPLIESGNWEEIGRRTQEALKALKTTAV